jgi:hypothetical protein
MLHFQQHQTSPPSLHISANDGQSATRSSLTALRSFHGNLAAPYLDRNDGFNFAVQDQNLRSAILYGSQEQITDLLSSGISVNTRDPFGNTPLHTAILRGDVAIVKSLFRYGADVDAIGFKGKTPLHLGAASKEMLKLILKHSPTLSLQDDEGNTVLHYMLSIRDWWNDSYVKVAMETILSSGVDINLRNKFGESPLHRLVADVVPKSQSYMDMISGFLNHEPDAMSPMRNGLSLLAVFLDNSNILSQVSGLYREKDSIMTGYRCLEQFLDAGADPNMMHHSKPLILYCLENSQFGENGPWKPFLGRLFKTANLQVAGPGGHYPLHMALSRHHTGYRRYRDSQKVFASYMVVSSLLTQNAYVDVNQTNTAGASPLEIWLAGNPWGGPDVAKVALLLIDSGAQTTTLTSTGKTIFDPLVNLSKQDRVCLTKEMLKSNINFRRDDTDSFRRPAWTETWRSSWKAPLWHMSKAHLDELERLPSLPKSKGFSECAFVVVAEHLLGRHFNQLKLWRTGDLAKESVREDYEEYCAILRDCLDRKAEVDPSWYPNLLDLMDFN